MHILRKSAAFGALVAVALIAGSLQAQQTPPRDGDEAGEAEEEDTADVTIPMGKQAELSPGEMRQKSDELIAAMQAMLSRVVELQQVARKQKDVIKLNCVNDKLIQIKQLLNIAESSRTDLIEAIAQDDEAGRYHRFSQVTIASENVSTLREEAEACVGEELIFLGPTEVTVERPPIIDDPTADPPDDIVVEHPGYASPFL